MADMSQEQWEALCDGCGWCCSHVVQDDDDNELYQTDICCNFLDRETGLCTDYANRFSNVPDCQKVSLDFPEAFKTLPETCAYRRLYFGQGIPDWHPLITGSAEAMHAGGYSVRGKVIAEHDAGDLEDHIIAWLPMGQGTP